MISTLRFNTEQLLNSYKEKKVKYQKRADEHNKKNHYDKGLIYETKVKQIDWVISDLEDLLF